MKGGRPQGVLPQNWGGTELNHTVTCWVLKAMARDRRTSSHDEFLSYIIGVSLECDQRGQIRFLFVEGVKPGEIIAKQDLRMDRVGRTPL
ncbi:hypothetical protein TNCV_1546151 [Trichonephila clavipes]|nr:hypothetical protein TNCV_1546151 [Trichonephila clavipes]